MLCIKKKSILELENELSELLKEQSEIPKIKVEGLFVNHTSFERGYIVNDDATNWYINFNGNEKTLQRSLCLSKKLLTFENKEVNYIVYKENEINEKIEAVKKEIVDKKKKHFYSNIKKVSKELYTKKSAPIIDKNAFSKLDNQQKKVLETLENTNNNYFITGKAGTGKSYVLDIFRKTTRKKLLILAPTGIAALNVQGTTIHSTFGYKNINEISIDDIPCKMVLSSEKRKVLEAVETIIIDEISMVRADYFEKIDKILKNINRNDQAFGGKQIIIVGDLFQLPPITNEDELPYLKDTFGGIYFFNSNAYKQGNFKFIELTINHRQKDDAEFFETLNRIRCGDLNEQDIALINERILPIDSAFNGHISVVPYNKTAKTINTEHINQLILPEYTYTGKIVYPKDKKWSDIKNPFCIYENLTLRKGAQVMMVTNDLDNRWVNGTIGIVDKITENRISVTINGRSYEVEPQRFTQKKATYKNGNIEYEDALIVEQYPVIPAYAISIHKSQGQTYKNIICDIEDCFEAGQAYVALSRCTSFNGLHMRTPINRNSILVNRDVLKFLQEQKNMV